MDKDHIDDHLGRGKDLGDKSHLASQSFRGPEWSMSIMDQQFRRNQLLNASCRFDNISKMRNLYNSIQDDMMENYEIESIDVLNAKHDNVIETINNKFEQVLARCRKNSEIKSEINNVLSKNKSVNQQALKKLLDNIDVSEEEDGKVMDVILVKTHELRLKPANFLIRNRGKERNEIIKSINTRIEEMNEVLSIYKSFCKIKKFAGEYLGDSDKEIIENMSSAFSQLLNSYKGGNRTKELIINFKEYSNHLKGLPEAIDICKKADEFKSVNNELISLFSKDMNTISEAYSAFRDRYEHKDISRDLLQWTLQDKWTHLIEELRGNLKKVLEEHRNRICGVLNYFENSENLQELKQSYEEKVKYPIDFSRYNFDTEDIREIDEHVTNVINVDVETLEHAILHIGNTRRREWDTASIPDGLKAKKDGIEQQMGEIAPHLVKKEKPDNYVEQLIQLAESIKEFDKELVDIRSSGGGKNEGS